MGQDRVIHLPASLQSKPQVWLNALTTQVTFPTAAPNYLAWCEDPEPRDMQFSLVIKAHLH